LKPGETVLRAIVWKELREQGPIGVTLFMLGSSVLGGVAGGADPPVPTAAPADVIRFLGAGLLATLMLAVTAGMVCGGAVFAAEREAGTMPFLESLPSTRWRLWLAKLTAGLVLATVESTLFIAISAALNFIPTFGWAVSITLCSLLAFVWGVFGSTASRTTLGSVGLAIPLAVLTAMIVLIPIVIFFQRSAITALRPTGALVFLLCMFVVPIGMSAWLFTAPDRLRVADGERSVNQAPFTAQGAVRRRRRSRLGISAILWMTRRQLRIPGLVLSAFALVLGLGLIAPGILPILAWPGLALAAGVFVGVISFADEQTRGSAWFWGEQRLPVGRVWAVKIVLHMLFCLWLLLLLALPLVIQSQIGESRRPSRGHSILATVFHTQLFDELGRNADGPGWNGWKFILLPAVYGFVVGHLCGLLFRKPVVACGVAGILGGGATLLWGPSLLAGGINNWQLWLPAGIVLLTARLLIPAWTSGRMFDRRSITTLTGGSLASVLAMIAGIGYRVLEIPDRPDGEDDIRYVSQLPPIDDNVGRREFRTAAERYARVIAAISPAFDRPDASAPLVGGRRMRVEERQEASIRTGWPAADPELEAWMERLFTTRESDEQLWHLSAIAAANEPGGMFEYPQLVGAFAQRDATLVNAQRMSLALLARGLQKQAAGDPAAFLPALRTAMILGKSMRNGSITAAFQTGLEVERNALSALDRWLDRLSPHALIRAAFASFPQIPAAAIGSTCNRPDFIRAAIGILESFDPTEPFDPTPHALAERFVLREALKAPQQWLPLQLTPPGENPEKVTQEAELVGVAWAVPWERERTRRLVGLGYEMGSIDSNEQADPRLLSGRPGAILMIRTRHANELVELERSIRWYLRATLLKLALRAYKAERGNFPAALGELPALGYLRRLPADPHDESRGFGYRLAPLEGETLRASPRPGFGPFPAPIENTRTRFIPAGQAIIWSVGSDKIDQGGTSLPMGGPIAPDRPEDLVYVISAGPGP
jgi:hypothetical protein